MAPGATTAWLPPARSGWGGTLLDHGKPSFLLRKTTCRCAWNSDCQATAPLDIIRLMPSHGTVESLSRDETRPARSNINAQTARSRVDVHQVLPRNHQGVPGVDRRGIKKRHAQIVGVDSRRLGPVRDDVAKYAVSIHGPDHNRQPTREAMAEGKPRAGAASSLVAGPSPSSHWSRGCEHRQPAKIS